MHRYARGYRQIIIWGFEKRAHYGGTFLGDSSRKTASHLFLMNISLYDSNYKKGTFSEWTQGVLCLHPSGRGWAPDMIALQARD